MTNVGVTNICEVLVSTMVKQSSAPVPVVPDPRRWWALTAIGVGQLGIAVDATITNIALPSIQRSLDMPGSGRQWVLTVFALGYGGFLLLGGRLSELLGRRACLLIGLGGFAAASVLGGLAVNPAMLLTARALQGVFGALYTPSALALLGTTFVLPAERGKAFGIYGTLMGSASGAGLILGGLLTDYASWRWCMFVGVPIATASVVGILYAIRPTARVTGVKVDVVGAVLATAGLMALVFGFARAEIDGWGAPLTVGSLVAGVLLLAAFSWAESRTAHALLPLRVILDRRRGGSYLAVLSMATGLFAAFYFLTFYLQNVLGYSPLRTGLAFLPFTVAILIGVRVVRPFMMRVPVRLMLCPGLLSTAAGLAVLGLLRADSSYWTHVMPVFVLLGMGIAMVLVPANSTATLNAGPDTGVAGASVMTFQQIGFSLGIALLSTIAGTATADFLGSHAPASDLAARAAVHGYNVAGLVGASFLVAAAVAVYFVTGSKKPGE